MRKIKHALSTGCLFFCLGGWVYNGQVSAAEEANQAINTAVAQAAAPQGAATGDTQLAQAAEQPAPPAPRATTAPAGNVDLNTQVVNIGVDGRVEQFSVQDADIVSVLHLLSLQTKRNIIASKDVKGTVTANLYNVTFQEALQAILKPNGFDYIEQGNFIYVYTAKEIEDIRKRDRKAVNQIFHLKYINANDASTMIKPVLSSSAIVSMTAAAASGLASGTTDTGGLTNPGDDIIIVNDFPENIADVASTLKQIDVRPKEVLIEATVLNASLNDNNALGIDLVSVSGVDFSSLTGGAFSSGSGGTTGSTGSTGTGTGTGTGSTGTVINGPGGIANNFLGGTTEGNVATDFSSQVPSGGLSVGFLSNHIAFFMRALETVTDVTIVANPKILALNKMKGEVHIGQKLGYLTTSTSQTTTQQEVQFLDVGTKLVFRPYIAEDGYVRMEIHPEDSSGVIDSRGVPQTNTTEVTSNVMIRDGRTIVIGGLFSESTTAAKGQVPILGNIPILGTAFKRTNDSVVRQETIVLVTPHIINDDTSLYEESLREQEDIQRMQLGNRAGLQPWGRDRIAHMWYAKAQECADKGDTEKALMYTDWAINTEPRLLEALKLREQLTHKKMDEKSGSSVADLVKNTLQGDAATTPDTGSSANYPPPTTAPADKK